MSIASTSRGSAVHWNGDRPLGLTGCDGSRCAQVVANIRHWQTQVRQPPFRDIAYNHLICPGCGTIHQGRGWGVRSAANGTTAANREWHAWMVMVGGDEPFTDIARQRLLELAREHRDRYGRSRLTYHRAVRGGGTECPGTTIIGWVRSGAPLDDSMTVEDFMATLSPSEQNTLKKLAQVNAEAVDHWAKQAGKADREALGDFAKGLRTMDTTPRTMGAGIVALWREAGARGWLRDLKRFAGNKTYSERDLR